MRLRNLIMALIMLFACAMPALAAGPTLNIGIVNGAPGQNVTVPITLANNGATIAGLGVDIAYDPAVLTPVTGAIGAAGTAADKSLSQNLVSPGTYRIGVAGLNQTLIGDGVVATMSFTVAAGASGNVTLGNTPSASNANGDPVAITGANGQIIITVIKPTLNIGTVNGAPGQNVTVPITLANNGAAIAGLGVDIAYDPAVLTPVTGAIGAAGTAAGKSLSQNLVSPGTYRIGVAGLNQTLIGDGVIATMSFTVAAGASGNVTLGNTPSASNANGESVVVTGANGQINLPIIPPSITAFTIPASGSSLTVNYTSLAASANTAAYLITEISTAPAATNPNWKTTKPTSYTFATYGAKNLYAWAKDKSGNISTASVRATTTLTEPPATVTAFVVPATVYSVNIPITTFTGSANAVAYLITLSATAPAASAITATNPPTTFTVAGLGSYTLYAWVKNTSGAVSAPVSQTATVAAKPAPVLKITSPVNNLLTNDSTVTMTGTTTKNPAAASGDVTSVTVNGVAVTLGANGTFSKAVTLDEGTNTITVIASDNQVPPVTATNSLTVVYDKTSPILSVNSPPDGLQTRLSPVNVSGTVTDANGIKALKINGATVTVGANGAFSYAALLAIPEGDKTITVEATDNADNILTVTRTIKYDLTPMTLTVTAPADNSQTNNAIITVSGAIGEADGIVEIRNATNSTTATNVTKNGTNYTGSIQLVSGTNLIQVTVTDAAGNKSTTVARTVLYDPNSPALAITDPAHDILTNNANYTIKGTVSDATTVTLSMTFNGATFAPVVTSGKFQQAITIPSEGQYQVIVTATDAVNNPVSAATRNIIYTPNPGDTDGDGATEKLVEALKALKYTLGQGTLTTAEKLRLDCAPLGADGKPNPNGLVDGGDVILLLRRIIGLVNW